ncbi:MAG: hypothetical protein EOM20_19445 [Spartobacteria bacterium]|nr:hypothetical protein [Spartobacteria bacterium]
MPWRARTEAKSSIRGFTLLETLLATVIVILILACVYSVWHTAMRVREGQEQRTRGPMAATEAMEMISRDLACAVRPPLPDEPALSLQTAEPLSEALPISSIITFFTTRPAPPSLDAGYYTLEKTTYTILLNDDIPVLYSIRQPVVGPGTQEPPRTNPVLSHVSDFNVQVHDGQTWQPAWPPGDAMEALPGAARIRLGLQGKGAAPVTMETETVIAAGMMVTTRLTRTHTP